jgi:uncharacterized protein YndB with AHSA1/START domain
MTSSTSRDELGKVIREDDRVGLLFVRRFDHPVERVWQALTSSEELRCWFPADIVGERRQGAQIRLPFWPDHVAKYEIEQQVLTGRIEVWDPPRVFQWTWDRDILRFELEPAGGATILRFTTWPEDVTRKSLANSGSGYHVCLHALRQRLDTGTDVPLLAYDALVGDLAAEYAATLA